MTIRHLSDEQLNEIIQKVAAGTTTLTEEAKRNGLSRERVRQLVHKHSPDAVARGKAAREQAHASEQQQKKERAVQVFSCQVCGRSFKAAKAGNWPAAACSVPCRAAWRGARYQLDPERRWSHTVAMARWHLKHAGSDKQIPSELAWAKRVVAAHARGEKIGSGRRSVNKQSKGYALVVKALGSDKLATDRITNGIRPFEGETAT